MRWKTFVKNHGSTLGLIAGILCIRSSFAEPYQIPSGSMEPTLQIGDRVLVNKMAYDLKLPLTGITVARMSEPERGDVVVFADPRDSSRNLIKRLVGLPGDSVRVKNGRVWINGVQASLSAGTRGAGGEIRYVESLGKSRHEVQRLPHLYRPADQELQVPQGQYFFLGDNRDNSSDGREWGFAPHEALKGRASFVMFNVSWNGLLPEVRPERTGEAMAL